MNQHLNLKCWKSKGIGKCLDPEQEPPLIIQNLCVQATVLHVISFNLHNNLWSTIIMPSFKMKKQSLKHVKEVVQDHTASKWQRGFKPKPIMFKGHLSITPDFQMAER